MKAPIATLETLGDGAIPELFEVAWKQVLENVVDPNTEPTKVRKVLIEVSVKPAESRDRMKTTVQVKARLADVKPVPGELHVGRADGQLVAIQFDPNQLGMFDDRRGDVVPLHKSESEGAH